MWSARSTVLAVLLFAGVAGVAGCAESEDVPLPPEELPPPPEERPPAEGTANDAVATFPPPEEDLDLEDTDEG